MTFQYSHNGAPIRDGQIINEITVTKSWLDGLDDDRLAALDIEKTEVVKQGPRPAHDSRFQILSPLDDGTWQVSDRMVDDALVESAVAVVSAKAEAIRNEALGVDRTQDAVKHIKQGLAAVEFAALAQDYRDLIEVEAAAYGMTGEQLHELWRAKNRQLTLAALGLDAVTQSATAAIRALAAKPEPKAAELFAVADGADFSAIEAALAD